MKAPRAGSGLGRALLSLQGIDAECRFVIPCRPIKERIPSCLRDGSEMKKLLIVESPAKAKTIGKYLGDEFSVMSSVGHIRDLPKKGGLAIKITPVKGVEGEWTFKPSYEVSPDKKKVVAGLRTAAKSADEIYLAPDPDREGEAIAWHLSEVLRRWPTEPTDRRSLACRPIRPSASSWNS